jgi:hypothetical protein
MADERFPFGLAHSPAVHDKPIQAGPQGQQSHDRRIDACLGLSESKNRHADHKRQHRRCNHDQPGHPLCVLPRFVGEPASGPVMVDKIARDVLHQRLLCCHFRVRQLARAAPCDQLPEKPSQQTTSKPQRCYRPLAPASQWHAGGNP